MAFEVSLAEGYSQIGGGALPVQNLKTRLVALLPKDMSVNRLENWFRTLPIPIIGRIEEGRFLLDVRTMADEDYNVVIKAVSELASGQAREGK